MRKYGRSIAFLPLIFISLAPISFSQGPPGPPPALVAVGKAASGVMAPRSEFTGTVYYRVASEVASEVRGKVMEVTFEEGDSVKKRKVLVKLDTELQRKSIDSAKASHGQVLAELERANLDLKRIESLFKEGLATQKAYDDSRLLAKGLERRAASLKAEVDRLKTEVGKADIYAPFDGIIIKKQAERGEWVEAGKPIAILARADFMDAIVDVPEAVMASVKKGMDMEVKSAGKVYKGKVTAIVPSGEIKTRTFPIKIRIKNDSTLAEGMEARVSLPTGEAIEALIVPRDAVITKFGTTAVFAVKESKAAMIPVKVIGYEGNIAGVEAEGLTEGMSVVIKGNERLSDGQDVKITDGEK